MYLYMILYVCMYNLVVYLHLHLFAIFCYFFGNLMHHLIFYIYICLSKENLPLWLTDDNGRDQFVIQARFDLEVYWNDPNLLNAELIHYLKVRYIPFFSFTGN